jgi:hypothetical protein
MTGRVRCILYSRRDIRFASLFYRKTACDPAFLKLAANQVSVRLAQAARTGETDAEFPPISGVFETTDIFRLWHGSC